MEENKEKQIREEVLDAYFMTRHNLPVEGAVQMNRSTEEIMDDLVDMLYLTKAQVTEYMINHEFHPTTDQDGSVKWAIWRIPI